MAGQGRTLREEAIRNIVSLLESTEMTIPEIAQRTGYSRTAILTINRKFQIRVYGGRRMSFEVRALAVREFDNDYEPSTD